MKITHFRATLALTCDECGHERRRRPVHLYRVSTGPPELPWSGSLVLCRRCIRELRKQVRGVRT